MGREGVSDKMGGITSWEVLVLGGLRSSSQSLDQLALLLREIFHGGYQRAISLTSELRRLSAD